jgi:hypothetical protein
MSALFGALFAPDDVVVVRLVETWTDGNGKRLSRTIHRETVWAPAGRLATSREPWQHLLSLAEREHANVFFGVCPRVGGDGRYDLAWQIRTVRALWADVDDCTPEEAIRRCETATLPLPSFSVSSGHGSHLYWVLDEPYAIDETGNPPAVDKA